MSRALFLLIGLLSGLAADRLLLGESSCDDGVQWQQRARALERENFELRDRLSRAGDDLLRALAERAQRQESSSAAVPAESADAPSVSTPRARRDADECGLEIEEALHAGNGALVLELLEELASLGTEGLERSMAFWGRLLGLDQASLAALGLSRIELAAALARQPGTMRFAMEATRIDPELRRFAADTLERAGPSERHAVLDDLDFSLEKDAKVLGSLLRAVEEFRDSRYVERFSRLVDRGDLYNNTRQKIALMIAEVGGDQAQAAIESLRSKGGHERILPVLEIALLAPADGLLVWNGDEPRDHAVGLCDVILEYNGRRTLSVADLLLADSTTRPGDIVPMRLYRKGDEVVITLTVASTAPGHLHFDAVPIRTRR